MDRPTGTSFQVSQESKFQKLKISPKFLNFRPKISHDLFLVSLQTFSFRQQFLFSSKKFRFLTTYVN